MSVFSLPNNISEIIERMNGKVQTFSNGWQAAILPSPCIQNHAAFLYRDSFGELRCAWFAGGLEGKSDICIHSSILDEKTGLWQSAQAFTDDPVRSEQNPVLFSPDGQRTLLFHSPAGGIRINVLCGCVRLANHQKYRSTYGQFRSGTPHCSSDGAWLLPLHHCTYVPVQGGQEGMIMPQWR